MFNLDKILKNAQKLVQQAQNSQQANYYYVNQPTGAIGENSQGRVNGRDSTIHTSHPTTVANNSSYIASLGDFSSGNINIDSDDAYTSTSSWSIPGISVISGISGSVFIQKQTIVDGVVVDEVSYGQRPQPLPQLSQETKDKVSQYKKTLKYLIQEFNEGKLTPTEYLQQELPLKTQILTTELADLEKQHAKLATQQAALTSEKKDEKERKRLDKHLEILGGKIYQRKSNMPDESIPLTADACKQQLADLPSQNMPFGDRRKQELKLKARIERIAQLETEYAEIQRQKKAQPFLAPGNDIIKSIEEELSNYKKAVQMLEQYKENGRFNENQYGKEKEKVEILFDIKKEKIKDQIEKYLKALSKAEAGIVTDAEFDAQVTKFEDAMEILNNRGPHKVTLDTGKYHYEGDSGSVLGGFGNNRTAVLKAGIKPHRNAPPVVGGVGHGGVSVVNQNPQNTSTDSLMTWAKQLHALRASSSNQSQSEPEITMKVEGTVQTGSIGNNSVGVVELEESQETSKTPSSRKPHK